MPLLYYRTLAIISIVGILLVVATPSDTVNAILKWIAQWLAWPASPRSEPGAYADKVVHAGMFLCSAFLVTRAQFYPRLHLAGLFLVILLFAVFTELLQFAVPGRSPSVADLAADAAGIGLGILLARALWRRQPEPLENA